MPKQLYRSHFGSLDLLEQRLLFGAGEIFIANAGGSHGAVAEYNTAGIVLNDSLIPVSGLNVPYGIAVSGSDLFVANEGNHTIGAYTISGTTLNASLVSGVFDGPGYITVSGSDLFVANWGNGSVGEYTTSGATINTSLLHLASASGIAVLESDLFITNPYAGTIAEFTTSGALVDDSLISGLHEPDGLAVSGSDLFVANNSTGTIGEYTTSGATVNADLVSGLTNPRGIAVSGSDLFVVNEDSGTIEEYTTSGLTVNADLISGLNSPIGIAVTPTSPTGAVTGFAYDDANGNGIYNSGEKILAGVTVTLQRMSGRTPMGRSLTTTTDRRGDYSFVNIPAGNFTVTETLPSGYKLTEPALRGGGYAFSLAEAETIRGVNFGNEPIVKTTIQNAANLISSPFSTRMIAGNSDSASDLTSDSQTLFA